MGHRCLRRWLLQPLLSKLDIEQRLDVITYLLNTSDLHSYLQNTFLARIPDLDVIAAKLYKIHLGLSSSSSLADICKVYNVIGALRLVYTKLESMQADSSAHIQQAMQELVITPLKLAVEAFSKYSEFVEKFVDLERFKNSGDIVLSCHVSPELEKISEKMKKVDKQI